MEIITRQITLCNIHDHRWDTPGTGNIAKQDPVLQTEIVPGEDGVAEFKRTSKPWTWDNTIAKRF